MDDFEIKNSFNDYDIEMGDTEDDAEGDNEEGEEELE